MWKINSYSEYNIGMKNQVVPNVISDLENQVAPNVISDVEEGCI
jgi:hypothetical protein